MYFFKYISSTKKKYRTIQGVQEILEQLEDTLKLYVWNYMHRAPPIFHSPTKGSPSFGSFPTPSNKAKFEIFQPPPPQLVFGGSSYYVYTRLD